MLVVMEMLLSVLSAKVLCIVVLVVTTDDVAEVSIAVLAPVPPRMLSSGALPSISRSSSRSLFWSIAAAQLIK